MEREAAAVAAREVDVRPAEREHVGRTGAVVRSLHGPVTEQLTHAEAELI